MRHQLDLAVYAAGRRVKCETTAEASGADAVLVFSSTAPGVTLRSVYVGVDDAPCSHVVHTVQRRDRLPAIDDRAVPRDELPVTHARELCLIDHAARLQEVLKTLDWASVRIDVDAAAAAAANVYPEG